MGQSNWATDDCDNKFVPARLRNNKPLSFDCNQIASRRTGMRANSFTKKAINNTNGDTEVWTDELFGKIEKNY